MRASSNRRSRGGRSGSNGRSGASGGRGSGNNRRSNNSNRSYDSNGPDGKIRGSATQVYEKYTSLGRDAYMSGNPVAAENYYQHAEHYYRIMLANNLVKLPSNQEDESSEEQPNDSNAANQEQDEVTVEPKAEAKSNKKNDNEDVQEAAEPIIIDLSNPDDGNDEEASLKFVDAPAEDTTEASLGGEGAVEHTDDDKPKTKRRVSRTRGLRRRVTRRGSDSEEKASS